MKKLFCVAILWTALLSALGPAGLANAAQSKQLEVFSWWTSGGEAMALESLFHLYKYKYPGVEVLNAAVTGGGGSAARPVLQTRLAAGNPPDVWQSIRVTNSSASTFRGTTAFPSQPSIGVKAGTESYPKA
jgi:ABC-type glycerol-3-phosphate transport system substrate-binding protein